MIKKHKALLAYMLVLTVFTTYVVMDTFVIKRVYGKASGDGSEAALQIEDNNGSGEKAGDSSEDMSADNDADDTESSNGHGPDGDLRGGTEIIVRI